MQTLVNFPRRVGLRPLSHQRALLFRPNATRSYSLHPLLQKDREELEKKTPEQPKAPQGKTPPPNPKPSIPFKPKDSSHPKKQPEPLVASTPSETKPSVHPILQRNLAALEKKQKAEKERAAAAAQKTKKPLAVELLAEEEEEEGEDSPERVVLDPEVEARVRAAAAAETAKLRDAALAKIRQAEISAKQATQLVMDEPVDEEEAAAAARAAEQESLREKLSQMTLKSNSKKRGDSDTDLFTTAASLGIAIPDAAGYKSSFEAEGRVVLPDDITLLQAKEQEIREMPTVQSVNKDIQKVFSHSTPGQAQGQRTLVTFYSGPRYADWSPHSRYHQVANPSGRGPDQPSRPRSARHCQPGRQRV